MSKEYPTEEEVEAAQKRYDEETAQLEKDHEEMIAYHNHKGSWTRTLNDKEYQNTSMKRRKDSL